MVATTSAELLDDLNDNLQWRRTELQALKSQLPKSGSLNPSSPASRMALRSGVVMLYAHWEGFTKHACQSYLDYVVKRGLAFNDLSSPFQITALRSLTRGAELDESRLEKIRSLVECAGAERVHLPKKKVVETRSNLRYEVLVEILNAIGIDHSAFSTANQLINRELCDARNEVAHGKAVYPDSDTLRELFERVIEMMEQLRSLLVTAAADGQYRAQPTTTITSTPTRSVGR